MNKIKLVAIAKNEGAYLAEWIHHHLYFGFDEVEIIYNQCTDNSVDILSKISKIDPRVKFTSGDEFYELSQKNSFHFQVESYKKAYEACCDNFDYLAFFDLDEYWIPLDFRTKISDIIGAMPDVDSISFPWHTDLPSRSEEFECSVKSQMKLQKNRHVKSIFKTKPKPEFIDIHNSVSPGSRCVLFDGTPFNFDCKDSCTYSVINELYFNAKQDLCDKYFVLHRIYRSEVEYLASLYRGRPIPGGALNLKANRWGYMLPEVASIVGMALPDYEYSCYFQSLTEFINVVNVDDDINFARDAVRSRADLVVDVAINNFDISINKKLMTGISDPRVNEVFHSINIACSIDVVSREKEVVVSGWAFDHSSGKKITPKFRVDAEQSLTRRARGDVVELFNYSELMVGFSVSLDSGLVKDMESIWLDFYLNDQLASSKEIYF